MNLVLVRAGIRTADALLAAFYGFAPLEKAGPDPLTPRGFDKTVLGVLRELRAGVDKSEKRAVEALLRELEGKDWVKLGESARDKAFRDAAEKYLGFGPDVGAAVGQVARHVGPTIIAGTKAAAVHRDRLRIEPSLNAVDERMVVAAATHQALFARDEHGKRSAWLSDRARAVVSQGLEEGLDRYEIAKRIRSDLGAAADARSQSYWRLIASVFTGRARTYGHLSAMSESGVEEFEIESVLDEVTTLICRLMHGKVFSTGAGLARFAEVGQAQDPEDVKNLQPWASTGKTEDGGLALFYKANGARNMIARVDESAAGKKDEVGKFSGEMSRGAMEKAGLTTPPFHGHCRTTALPVLGAVQVLPGGPGREELDAPLPMANPPKTEGFDLSRHARSVTLVGITPEALSGALAGVNDPGLLKWLGDNPLDEFVVSPRTSKGGNGAYNVFRGRLQLAHERDPAKLGREFEPGKTFSFSQLGRTRDEALTSTLLHELGHHLHGLVDDKVRVDADKVFEKIGGATLTKYGGASASEHFAESFSAYFTQRPLLKKHSPEAYAMVERALKAAKIPVEKLPKAEKPKPEKTPAKPKKPTPLGTIVPPPELSVKKPPKKPGELPTFTAPGGTYDLARSGTESEKKAVLFAYRDDLAWALGLGKLAEEDGVDWAALEDALRERASGGGLANVVQEFGQLRYLGASRADRVSLPPGFNRDKLAAATIDPRRLDSELPTRDEDKARAPVVVRYKGKTVFYDGAEQFVAKRIRQETDGRGLVDGAYVRFIDLDAPLRQQVLGRGLSDRERAETILALSDSLGSISAAPGAEPAEAQRAARNALRNVLRANGIVPRDAVMSRYSTSSIDKHYLFDEDLADAEKLRSDSKLAASGALATHGHTGVVKVDEAHLARGVTSLRKLASDPAAFIGKSWREVNAPLEALASLLHEELHGASRGAAASYQGAGLGMEEAATEILARKLTRELLGYRVDASNATTVPFGLPVKVMDRYIHGDSIGAYNTYIEGLFASTARHSGHKDIHERVERALLRTRQGTESDAPWRTGEDQIRAYVDALELPKDKGDALYTELTDPTSTLR